MESIFPQFEEPAGNVALGSGRNSRSGSKQSSGTRVNTDDTTKIKRLTARFKIRTFKGGAIKSYIPDQLPIDDEDNPPIDSDQLILIQQLVKTMNVTKRAAQHMLLGLINYGYLRSDMDLECLAVGPTAGSGAKGFMEKVLRYAYSLLVRRRNTVSDESPPLFEMLKRLFENFVQSGINYWTLEISQD